MSGMAVKKVNSKKLRVGDDVKVIAGRDKGKIGKILRKLKDGRLIVEGVNMITKHEKPNPNMQKPGGRINKEAPIQFSNVNILNPQTDKADKVGFKFLDDGTKVRIFKSNGEVIDS